MTVAAASKNRQIAEEQQLSEQPDWGQIFSAMPDAVVVLDSRGTIFKANNSAFTLLNHELIGYVWSQIIEALFQPTRLDGTPLKLQSGEAVTLVTEPLMSGSGQLIVIRELVQSPSQVSAKKLSQVQSSKNKGEVVAKAPSSLALLQLANRVAQSEVTVMITGESGTGKEVIARYIHDHSQRANKNFVAINCAAIPETMLEATLFGYEKGAFTGAIKATPGKFEQANGGTLLLDEISEMDLGLQAKLLRVLQEREVERLGSTRTTPLDVRILATSNRDMRQQVEEGKFREDLYYRLIVFPLHLQPLRERPLDIEPMAQISLQRVFETIGKDMAIEPKILAPDAIAKLNHYAWPGNIRELDNVMQRAVILSLTDTIAAEDIQFDGYMQHQQSAIDVVEPVQVDEPKAEMPQGELNQDMQQQEYLLIQKALSQGSRKAAAEKLAISERTLRYKIAKLREAGFQID